MSRKPAPVWRVGLVAPADAVPAFEAALAELGGALVSDAPEAGDPVALQLYLTEEPARERVTALLAAASLAAVVLFGVAIAADYNWVARIGGAGWVFFLTMIILMPIVPSLLRARAGQETLEASISEEFVKDPVCGMEIDPASAAGSSEYEGRTYHFCNLNCKQSFDAEPEKYAKK